MSTGKRFRLREAVLGIERVHGRYLSVPIPSGETVVLSGLGLADIRIVNVQWQDRNLLMFAEDIESRGTELKQNGTESIASQKAAAIIKMDHTNTTYPTDLRGALVEHGSSHPRVILWRTRKVPHQEAHRFSAPPSDPRPVRVTLLIKCFSYK